MTRTIDRHANKACAECSRLLPRKTAYKLRYNDDPFGVAHAENKRRGARGQPKLVGEERLTFIAITPPPKTVGLLVQPRCTACDRLRSRRKAFARAVLSRFPDAELRVHDIGVASRLMLSSPMEDDALAVLVLAAARRGLSVIDSNGKLVAAEEHDDALHGAYALLTTSMRIGRLGVDQEDAIKLIRERSPLSKTKIGKWGQDVIDAVYVREGMSRASDAFVRIMARYKRHHAKIAWAIITQRKAEEDWVWGRYDEAFLHGIRKWDPTKTGALPTYIGHWVQRYLAPTRTRADRALGVYQDADGKWSAPALSLQGLSEDADSSLDIVAASYTAGGARPSPSADAAVGIAADVRVADVRAALSALTEHEQEIAWRIYANGETQLAVGADLGMTRADLREQMDIVAAKLRWQLTVGYREQE